MSNFFFDIFDGNTTVEDRVGLDLADVSAAREQAEAIALSRIGHAETKTDGFDHRELRIRAGAGHCVGKIAFRYVSG